MAEKARVHELAREFGVPSKDVLGALKEMGEFVKSASSTVEAPVVRRLTEVKGDEWRAAAAAKAARAAAAAAKKAAKTAESTAGSNGDVVGGQARPAHRCPRRVVQRGYAGRGRAFRRRGPRGGDRDRAGGGAGARGDTVRHARRSRPAGRRRTRRQHGGAAGRGSPRPTRARPSHPPPYRARRVPSRAVPDPGTTRSRRPRACSVRGGPTPAARRPHRPQAARPRAPATRGRRAARESPAPHGPTRR